MKCPECGAAGEIGCPDEALGHLIDGEHCLRRQLSACQEKLEKAQAIVDKLPRTADGVPVPPDMPVFHPDYLHQKGEYGYLWVDYDTHEALSKYKDFGRPITECFSTRAAAEQGDRP